MSDHIISLEISNVKRLTAVKIEVKNGERTVVITGENGAGKSSVLDSIEMALSGRAIPEQPIRDGKETARIVMETEQIIVTRTFVKGNNYLKLENKEGFRASSPQKLLDEMIEKIGFDPLAFATMDSTAQGKKLLALFPTKLDLNQNASFAKGAYDERTEINREIKRLQASMAAHPIYPDQLPTEEVSISALANKSTELRTEIENINRLKAAIIQEGIRLKGIDEEICDLKDQIADLETRRANTIKQIEGWKEKEVREPANIEKEIAAVTEKINGAEAINAQVRARKQLEITKQALSVQEKKAEDKTGQMAKLAEERSAALKEAKFPVTGLSIDEAGNVTLNGVLFSQASMAQKLIVGIAIAAAANSKLRVCLIRDASLLDAKSMKIVQDMAKEKDIQIWMERIEDSSPAQVQIVEGSNIGATDAPEVQDVKAGDKPEKAEKSDQGAEFALGGAPAPAKKGGRKKASENTDPFRA